MSAGSNGEHREQQTQLLNSRCMECERINYFPLRKLQWKVCKGKVKAPGRGTLQKELQDTGVAVNEFGRWLIESQARKNRISWNDDVGENSPGGTFFGQGLPGISLQRVASGQRMQGNSVYLIKLDFYCVSYSPTLLACLPSPTCIFAHFLQAKERFHLFAGTWVDLK